MKKIMRFMLALVMILGVFGLTACDNISLADYKATAITAIESHATAMKAENGYAEAGYAEIDNAVAAGTTAVNASETKAAVKMARDTAIQAIDNVDKEEVMEDFSLTISVEKTTVAQGEVIKVIAELKNISEQDREISFHYGFIAHIPGFMGDNDSSNPSGGELPELQTKLLVKGEVMRNLNHWGDSYSQDDILLDNYLSLGNHELRFYFQFNNNGQRVIVRSNTLVITVQ